MANANLLVSTRKLINVGTRDKPLDYMGVYNISCHGSDSKGVELDFSVQTSPRNTTAFEVILSPRTAAQTVINMLDKLPDAEVKSICERKLAELAETS